MWKTSHFAGVNDMNRGLMIVGRVPIYGLEVYVCDVCSVFDVCRLEHYSPASGGRA